MYLIGLSNIDYVWVTLFFSLYILNAYLKRKTNDSYNDYVGVSTRYNIFPNISFGFLEIIGVTYFGALYGLSAGYFFVLIIALVFISKLLLNQLFNRFSVNNITELLNQLNLKPFAILLTIVNVLLLIAVISLVMNLVYTSTYSLMGWHFSYSVYALFGICLIAIIIGGRSGLVLNKILIYAVIIAAFLTLVISYWIKTSGDWSFISKLQVLAPKQHLASNHYTSLLPFAKFHLSLWGYGILMYLIYILNHKRSSACITKYKYVSMVLSILVLIMLITPPLIALTTQSATSGSDGGRKFVTQETQFSDGQMGYIIKAVDTDAKSYVEPAGIIPPFASGNQSLLAYDGDYNYSIANLVAFEYYVPAYMMVLCLLMLLAGFLINIGDYLFQLSQMIVDSIIIPSSWLDKYGDSGKLWALRITIFSISLTTLVIAKLTVGWFGPFYG